MNEPGPPPPDPDPDPAADPNPEPTASSPADPGAEPDREAHDLHWRVPLVAIGPVALAFGAAMVVAFGLDLVLVAVVPFVVMLAAVTVIDLRELRVPNRIVAPSAIAALPLLALASLSAWPDLSLWRALIAALAMGGGYFVLALVYPAGMGLGDVKLAPLIGAQLGLFGWVPTVRGLLLAFLLVGPVALVLLALRRARFGTGLPFAPFMALGAVGALVLEGLAH